jgi:hypothetical protein
MWALLVANVSRVCYSLNRENNHLETLIKERNIMSDNISNAGITMRVTASGEPEVVELPFKADKVTLMGKFPLKMRVYIALSVVGVIAYFWGLIVVMEHFFPNAPKGTLGYNLASGLGFVGLFALAFVTKVFFERGAKVQQSDRYDRQWKFAEEKLGPWLEKNGNIKNGDFAAEKLLYSNTLRIKEDENSWGAFNLEFVAYGFNKQKQELRIWRWNRN